MGDVPTVSLGGRDFPIPVLAIKQARIVVPTLVKVLPELEGMFAAVKQGGGAPAFDISTETYDRIVDVVYTALTRGTPALARAEFENMEISLLELIDALNVVITQSGAFKKGEPGAAPEGEAVAAVTSTLTSSPPNTVSSQESPGPMLSKES